MKDEKQVQIEINEVKTANEATEVKASNNDVKSQIISSLGLDFDSQPEESAEERSVFIIIPDLILQCKTTVKNNKTFKDYILHGKLREAPVEVYFRPGKNNSGFTDVNGYKLLDIVFGSSTSALFAVRVITRTDSRTQLRTRTMEYVAYTKDEQNGFEYYAPLVLGSVSDRAVLTQLLTCSNVKYDLKLPL